MASEDALQVVESRNTVLSLHHEGEQIFDRHLIKNLFLKYMRSTLGVSLPVSNFTPQALYTSNLDLSHLAEPVTDLEIEKAVQGLAKNKASGPDGIPSEFLHTY